MKSLILSILEAAKVTDRFDHDHFHIRIENSPYLPLCIESWNVVASDAVEGERRHISVCCYYLLNGDACQHPEMVFTDKWTPIYLYHPLIGIEMQGYVGEYKIRNIQHLAYLRRYAANWASELAEMDYLKAARNYQPEQE